MRISFFIVLKIFVDSDDQSSQTRHFRKSNLQTARRVHARLVSQDLWISGIDLNRQFSLFFAITVCRKLRRHHRTRWATINPVPIVGDAKRSSDDRVTAVRKNGHLNAHENIWIETRRGESPRERRKTSCSSPNRHWFQRRTKSKSLGRPASSGAPREREVREIDHLDVKPWAKTWAWIKARKTEKETHVFEKAKDANRTTWRKTEIILINEVKW